jgi:hypothetical protein
MQLDAIRGLLLRRRLWQSCLGERGPAGKPAGVFGQAQQQRPGGAGGVEQQAANQAAEQLGRCRRIV